MQTDRRAFLRVMAEFPVAVTRIDEDGTPGASFAGTTVNVCAGGVKLASPFLLEEDERLRLEVRFSKPPFLVFADATVVRVDSREQGGGCVCGLRFDDLDRYIEQRIVRWVFAEDRRLAERRSTLRVPLRVAVACVHEGDGDEFTARTIDLAGDGARIVAGRRMDAGDRLQIDLMVEQPAYRVECMAEVVWLNRVGDGTWGYGLRFDGLDRATQRQIAEHALAVDRGRRLTDAAG